MSLGAMCRVDGVRRMGFGASYVEDSGCNRNGGARTHVVTPHANDPGACTRSIVSTPVDLGAIAGISAPRATDGGASTDAIAPWRETAA
jgi:hypothetical protein